VGIGRPRARRTVARIVRFSRARVGRLERAGLRRLDTLARTGCATGSASASGAPDGTSTLERAGSPAPLPAGATRARPTATRRTPRNAVLSERKTHHGSSARGGSGSVPLLPPALQPARGADQTGVLFALIALAGGGYALWRRRRHRAAPD
jgi:hypothetical protein